MKVNGKFRTAVYRKPIKSIKTPITLFAFGDVHYGSPNFCMKKWQTFIQRVKDTPNRLILGMGDFFDFASTSERAILRSGLHESTESTFDTLAQNLTDELLKDIIPFRSDIIGLLEGNHHYEFKDGTTTTEYMCSSLQTPYMGVSGLTRIIFEYQGASCSKDIFAHHGAGAARLPGGSINRVQQMNDIIDADIYLMGHDHKRMAYPASRLYMDNKGTIKQRTIIYGRTGAFLRAYDPTGVSYVVDACLPPSDLGWLELTIKPYRERNGRGFGVDISATV